MSKLIAPPPFSVYTLNAASSINRELVAGTALVSEPIGASAVDVLCYYEGNIYKSSEMVTFEAKALHAAGRLAYRYPTIARRTVPVADLIKVGSFEGPSFADMHFVASVPEEQFAPECASARAKVMAEVPDAELLHKSQAVARAAQLLRRNPNMHLPRWIVLSKAAASQANPLGYVGGGDYVQTALESVLRDRSQT